MAHVWLSQGIHMSESSHTYKRGTRMGGCVVSCVCVCERESEGGSDDSAYTHTHTLVRQTERRGVEACASG